MANRKAKARRQALAQRKARERRRDLDRDAAKRRDKTATARATWQAGNAPRIARHDTALLPLIRELREARATWREIADWLTDRGVNPPGGAGSWSATAAWRIARRHGLDGRLAREAKQETPPISLGGCRVLHADGRVGWPTGPRQSVVEHDELVLPTIRTMRARGAIWREIAEHLEAKGVISPGRRDGHIRARSWTATGVWRIGKRHGLS